MLFSFCGIVWLFLSLKEMAPGFGSGDVYLFRDAASNYLLGHGFTTFSVERQISFEPHLYSSYTPGLQWLYICFARIFGNTPRAESLFLLTSAYLLDAIFIWIGLRFATGGWVRLLFFGFLALLFPAAGLAIMPDRPEYISLLILSAVLYILSRPFGWTEAVLAGVLALIGFLAEPIAGAFALFFIVGSWIAGLTLRRSKREPSIGRSGIKVAASLVLFGLGLSAIAVAAVRIDPQSVRRFNEQARAGGLQRTSDSRQGDFDWPPAIGGNAPPAQRMHKGRLGDIRASFLSFSKVVVIQSIGYVLCLFLVAGMVFRSRGPLGGRLALAVLGIVCLVMPAILFPLQWNYRMMMVPLVALALAFNWAQTRTAAASDQAPVLLLGLFFIACAPSLIYGYAIRVVNRKSYQTAEAQAAALRSYLSAHDDQHHGIFVVPDTHYYLYKTILGEMTTPRYLSAHENPALVSGVVNCYAGTMFFGPTTLPLPELLLGQPLHLLLSKQTDVPLSLPTARSHLNETWECDVYVREPDRHANDE